MGAPAVALPANEFQIQVLSGPDKGSAYRLLSARVSIGRDKDNDIVLEGDPKCSRQHALIIYDKGQFYIESRSQKNSLRVDGQECEKAPLRPGSVIGIGDTELRFVMQDRTPAHAPQPSPLANPGFEATAIRKPSKRRANSSAVRRWLIYGSVLGLLVWFFSGTSPKKPPVELRTDEQIDSDIAEARKLEELKTQQSRQPGPQGLAGEEAQAAYIRGFRDYRKGQYDRAIESFQACLSLNPDHSLCNRYLRLAQRRHNELIQSYMILGRKYRDQNQYQACTAAFRNVMSLVRDPSSKIYEEAKGNHDACRAAVEERY